MTSRAHQVPLSGSLEVSKHSNRSPSFVQSNFIVDFNEVGKKHFELIQITLLGKTKNWMC